MALAPFGINNEEWGHFCEGSNWNHMLLQNFTASNWRRIRDAARRSERPASSRQTAAISGEQGSEPCPICGDEVSYLGGCLPESRASTPLMDGSETQANHICAVSTWPRVSNRHVSVFKFRYCL